MVNKPDPNKTQPRNPTAPSEPAQSFTRYRKISNPAPATSPTHEDVSQTGSQPARRPIQPSTTAGPTIIGFRSLVGSKPPGSVSPSIETSKTQPQSRNAAPLAETQASTTAQVGAKRLDQVIQKTPEPVRILDLNVPVEIAPWEEGWTWFSARTIAHGRARSSNYMHPGAAWLKASNNIGVVLENGLEISRTIDIGDTQLPSGSPEDKIRALVALALPEPTYDDFTRQGLRTQVLVKYKGSNLGLIQCFDDKKGELVLLGILSNGGDLNTATKGTTFIMRPTSYLPLEEKPVQEIQPVSINKNSEDRRPLEVKHTQSLFTWQNGDGWFDAYTQTQFRVTNIGKPIFNGGSLTIAAGNFKHPEALTLYAETLFSDVITFDLPPNALKPGTLKEDLIVKSVLADLKPTLADCTSGRTVLIKTSTANPSGAPSVQNWSILRFGLTSGKTPICFGIVSDGTPLDTAKAGSGFVATVTPS